MRDYGKVHTSFWSSGTVRAMSEDGRALAMYLLTCPHGTIAGVFRLPDGYVAEDMQWDSERVRKGFAELLANGFANRCETTKWVWVSKHLEWNQPENPNQRKAAAKIVAQIPSECSWKLDFMRVSAVLLGIDFDGDLNPCETLSKGFANQEQEQEQEQKCTNTDVLVIAGKPSIPICPHQKIIELYAKHLPELPYPRIWEGQRQQNLSARWKWVLTAKKPDGSPYATEPESAMAFFDRFFAYVAKSDFLTGRNGAWQSCDLGWLVKAENFAKVISGNYENKEAA